MKFLMFFSILFSSLVAFAEVRVEALLGKTDYYAATVEGSFSGAACMSCGPSEEDLAQAEYDMYQALLAACKNAGFQSAVVLSYVRKQDDRMTAVCQQPDVVLQ